MTTTTARRRSWPGPETRRGRAPSATSSSIGRRAARTCRARAAPSSTGTAPNASAAAPLRRRRRHRARGASWAPRTPALLPRPSLLLAGVGLCRAGRAAAAGQLGGGSASALDLEFERPIARAPAGARPHACQIATNGATAAAATAVSPAAGPTPPPARYAADSARRFKPGGGRRPGAASAAPVQASATGRPRGAEEAARAAP